VHLYRGTTDRFVGDAVRARLAGLLADRFFEEFRYRPPQSEVNAWQNSLRAMADVLQLADLTDQGILVELRLPLTSRRLDVLVTGSNPDQGDSAVIVELKQWTGVGHSTISEYVTVAFGGRIRDSLHPSAQVRNYHRFCSTCIRHSRMAASGWPLARTSTMRSSTTPPLSGAPRSVPSPTRIPSSQDPGRRPCRLPRHAPSFAGDPGACGQCRVPPA